MKRKIFGFLFIFFTTLFICGCSDSTSSKTQNIQTINKENPVVTATPEFSATLADILNKGYTIADSTKVYYTKSADYEKVYFVGTIVKNSGQFYNAIWATNDVNYIGAGIVLSMNDYAIDASGMGDARTNKEPLSDSDDGYSRINKKLLDDMSHLINK